MKKTLLTFFCAFTTLMLCAQSAKTYSDNLIVTINDQSTPPIPADVLVTDNGDGTINFALKNFCLGVGDDSLPVGNIAIDNLKLEETSEEYYTFSYNGPLTITEGSLEGVDTWLGPMLGELPLELSGKLSEDKLYVAIGLNLVETMGQIIYVLFGTDDFETDINVVPILPKTNVMYDLQGMKLIRPNSGQVYLLNGKKYLKKN
ncbi:MAG: calycin-like domain-containing protein [Bacteroidaceae bacterium]|nr:calycin-like domain-containing protein [Bacteroidaceae bacterium]